MNKYEDLLISFNVVLDKLPKITNKIAALSVDYYQVKIMLELVIKNPSKKNIKLASELLSELEKSEDNNG